MRMYFLKNMLGVSLGTLLFSVMSTATIAEQGAAEGSKPSITVDKDAHSIVGDMFKKASVPVEFNPPDHDKIEKVDLTTPEGRVTEKLTILDLPEDSDEQDGEGKEWGYDNNSEDLSKLEGAGNPGEPALSKEDDMVPPAPEDKGTMPTPQVEVETEVFPSPAPQIEDVPQAPQVEVETVDPIAPAQDDEESLALQEETPVAQQRSSLSDRIMSPTSIGTRPVIIRPELTVTPIEYDAEKGAPKPKEDPNDPTSEGDRKGGRHKGPKFANIKLIPIIRMGENVQETGGLTVIKPWNS